MMMTFLPSLSNSGAAQNAPDASIKDSETESTGDEFAALIAMLFVPVALPINAPADTLDAAPEETNGANVESANAPLPTLTGSFADQLPMLNDGLSVAESAQQQNSDRSVIASISAPPISGEVKNEAIVYPLDEVSTQIALPNRSDKFFATDESLAQNASHRRSIDQFFLLDENSAPLALPHRSIDQLPSISEAVARVFDAARIDSLTTANTGSNGVATISIQELLDKNGSLHFRMEEAGGLAGQSEREGKGSLLEAVLRDIANAASTEMPHENISLKTEPLARPLAAATGGEPKGDNQQPDASTQTEAGSFAPSVTNSETPREFAGLVPGSTSSVTYQVVNPLIEAARQLANRETRTLRMQLRPEKFGQIDLQITRGGDGRLSAQMVADLHVARHALAEGIDHLRGLLEQSGLTVDRLEVRMALDSGGKSGNHAADNGDSAPIYSPDVGLFSSESSDAEDAHTTTERERHRLLNLRI